MRVITVTTILFFLLIQVAHGASPCVGGKSAGIFPCKGVDLQSRVSLAKLPNNPEAASNLWGYVDPDDGREYALLGTSAGTAVVEVTRPTKPRLVGFIKGKRSSWREVKAYSVFNSSTKQWDGYAYISTEAAQGIQIINLSKLPEKVSLVRNDRDILSAHTLFVSNVDFATGQALPGRQPYLYMNGTRTSERSGRTVKHEPGPTIGLTIFNLTNPKDPEIAGRYRDSYVHDIYVETFTGKRTQQCAPNHDPCEVAFAWTGRDFRIIDFTKKSKPVLLSTLAYEGLGYPHSGWISKNKNWIFNFDEFDEAQFGQNTTILTLNISDFRNPRVSGKWKGETDSIEHNGYTVGNKLYVAHYTRGLTIYDASKPNRLKEIAQFDTTPEDDANAFRGAWGVYPFLPSGNILISDIERGLFVVKEK